MPPNISVEYMVRGGLMLLGYGALIGLVSWLVLLATTRLQAARTPLLSLLLVVYFYGLLTLFTQQDARQLGFVFIGYVGPFTFKSLSSIFYYRSPRPVPGLLFHVIILVLGPRQHYGAGGWNELRGKKFNLAILKEWSKHFLYAASVVVLFSVLIGAWNRLELPYRTIVIMLAGAVIVLEMLEIFIDLHMLAWSFFGCFPGFFGRFAFYRARHIGEWWQRWNVPAINAFREITNWLGMRRSRFLNVMVVFMISGIIHQLLVMAYVRQLTFGTMISFTVHGLMVYLFGSIYKNRKSLPAALRVLLLNPLTTFVVFVFASTPFALDFLGWFTISF